MKDIVLKIAIAGNYCSDKTISNENVKNAVKVELEDPGAPLDSCAVPRDLVHDVMYCVDL